MKKNRIEIREERKLQIMEVALELFSKNGYHGVSVSQIAKACDVSKGLMYNYFESKDALLQFILEDYSQKIYIELGASDDAVLTKAQFEHFIRTIYRMVRENTKYYKLIFALSFQEDVAAMMHSIALSMMPFNYELLRAYFNSLGHKNPDLELMMFASVLKGFLLQVVMIPEFGDVMSEYESQFEVFVERMVNDFT